jgi:hydrogenase nickel incorporation protein HypB
MCETCGCTQPDDAVTIRIPGSGNESQQHGHTHANPEGHTDANPEGHTDANPEGHTNAHTHADGGTHAHEHEHAHMHGRTDDYEHNHAYAHGVDHTHDHDNSYRTHSVTVETDILQKNNLLAQHNRGWFEAKGILALNLVSSPGSGKTSLLERTIRELDGRLPMAVIEGDQQTMNDANRIQKAGAPVVQINTGNGCHLDADMVRRACRELNPAEGTLLMIENVGNLVCPSLFDLGEAKRVVIMSVTEGEDKPLKYPNMFRSSDICVINKMDLLPYLDYDLQKARDYALQVNHHLTFIEISVKSGEGFDHWLSWLHEEAEKFKLQQSDTIGRGL